MSHDIVERLKAEINDPSISLELRVLMAEAVGLIAEQKQYTDHMRHQIADRLPGDIAQRCDCWSDTLAEVERLSERLTRLSLAADAVQKASQSGGMTTALSQLDGALWRAKEEAPGVRGAIEELDRLKAQNARLREALAESKEDLQCWGGYVPEYFREKHSFDDDLVRIDDALLESPTQALAEIEARAVEAILKDMRSDIPDTNTARRVFQRLQLRADCLREKAKRGRDRGDSGRDREVLGQNNEGDTVTV